MADLAVLREITAEAEAEPSHSEAALPAGELRFVLEYAKIPDTRTERAAFVKLLGSDAFILRPLFAERRGELARFLLLAFPGVERTLPPEMLFAIAYALGDARNLVSAEPDLGARVFLDPGPPGQQPQREAADALGPLCWVEAKDEDLPQFLWALDNIRAREAWEFSGDRGEGVLVGQPDTGVAEHVELEASALRLELGIDILNGEGAPRDPLDPATANPGHGTGTASVVVGRETGSIGGSAPGAKLVPIRCIEDVKIFNAAPVAAAIDHARRAGCNVITMSLGGVPSRAMRKAIEKAVEAGIIVLAAAGNCVRVVVWPARYDAVIAVGGTNALDKPWRGTSRGEEVDISAPAEFVWRAQRNRESDPVDGVGAGQGTSFAVALTAGVAALWVARHGRDALLAEARRRGTNVQTLFRAALRATARRPGVWSPGELGAGIVNARALLELPLAALPAAIAEARPVRMAVADVRSLLAELTGDEAPPGPDDAFDWERYGLEVASLLLAMRGWAGVRRGAAPSGARGRVRRRRYVKPLTPQATDGYSRSPCARPAVSRIFYCHPAKATVPLHGRFALLVGPRQ